MSGDDLYMDAHRRHTNKVNEDYKPVSVRAVDRQEEIDDLDANVLRGMIKDAVETATNNGFHEDPLRDFMRELETAYDDLGHTYAYGGVGVLKRIHRLNVITRQCMLMVTEISEAVEALRNAEFTSASDFGNFMEEMADVMIRILDTVGYGDAGSGEEFVQAYLNKRTKNRNRGYRHGGKNF